MAMQYIFSIVPAFKLQSDFNFFFKYTDSLLSKMPGKKKGQAQLPGGGETSHP